MKEIALRPSTPSLVASPMVGGMGVPTTSVRLEIKEIDHLGVVSGLWDELGLTDLLNAAIAFDDQVAIKPGLMVKALVLNVVCGRDPLYRVQSFFEHRPIEVLLGGGVEAKNFNDAS